MKISTNLNWLSEYVQAHTNLPPIPMIRAVTEKLKERNMIKIKMHQDPTPATSKTYELKVAAFKNVKPEEFLQMMKDFNTKIYGIGNTSKTKKPTTYVICYVGKL